MKENEKKWLVIINKQVKGPYTVSEIEVFLKKNILSRNDVAMLVDDKTQETHSQNWKFLWQFSEFERRKKDDKPAIVPQEERRKTTPPIKIEEKLQEISDIEFIVNSKQESKESEILIVEEKKEILTTKKFSQKTVFFLLMTACCAVFIWSYTQKKNNVSAVSTVKSMKSTNITNPKAITQRSKTVDIMKRNMPIKREVSFSENTEEKKTRMKTRSKSRKNTENKSILDGLDNDVIDAPSDEVSNNGEEIDSDYGEIAPEEIKRSPTESSAEEDIDRELTNEDDDTDIEALD